MPPSYTAGQGWSGQGRGGREFCRGSGCLQDTQALAKCKIKATRHRQREGSLPLAAEQRAPKERMW